jgi:hypothetical protein
MKRKRPTYIFLPDECACVHFETLVLCAMKYFFCQVGRDGRQNVHDAREYLPDSRSITFALHQRQFDTYK